MALAKIRHQRRKGPQQNKEVSV